MHKKRPEAIGLNESLVLDLARPAAVSRVIRSPWFPYVFQALLLAVFVALAVLGWGRGTPEGVQSKLYAKANLVNLLIWGLWWPAMVWGAVLFGRVWCMVCPLELVSNICERLGRAVGLGQARIPGWIAAGGLIVIFYFGIQMWVAGAELHRVPGHTAVFLVLLLAGAALTGLWLRDRAFCRGFCPVGMLLNVYGRGGMLAVRPVAPAPCQGCGGRECKTESNRRVADARACPSLLNPSTLDTNKDCLVCLQCIKACPPGNLALALRRPFAAADFREALASWPVALFVFVASGFVTYEICSEWKAAQAVLLWPVDRFAAAFVAPAQAGWVKGAYLLLLLPALLWLVLGALTVASRGARSLGEALRRLALPIAVVVSAGHMAKGLAKFVTWGGFLPHTLRDPVGVDTALAMTAKTIAQPATWMPMPWISLTGFLLVLAGIVLGLREARLADASGWRRRAAPIVLLGAAYLFIVAGWSGVIK